MDPSFIFAYAISKQNLIRATANRLEPYQEFQQVKPRLESARRKEGQLQKASHEAGINDVDFWQTVNDRLGGVPTMEQLHQRWDEQDAIIRVIFGTPEADPPTADENDASSI
jgi:hypothetical protein